MGRRHRDLWFDSLLYGAGAILAVLVATQTRLAPHRSWGAAAAWGFAIAAAASAAALGAPWSAAARRRFRTAVLGAVVVSTAVAPAISLAIRRIDQPEGTAQSEVIVVEHMAQRLLRDATPYLDRDEIHVAAAKPHVGFRAYAPYQPAMAVFGLPRAAWPHWLTDARLVFLVTTLAIAASMVRTTGTDPRRTVQLLTVLPPAGLALATGGDDVPVVALCCWALALAQRRRFLPAAVVAAAALSLKLTAGPVALAVLALAGVSRVRRLALVAAGIPVLTGLPAMLIDAPAVVENLVRYPAGLAERHTTATSPLPGVLIAAHLPGGRAVTTAAGAAIGVWFVVRLWRRPARDAAEAAWRVAVVTASLVLVAPQARFGYLLYPLAFGALGAMMTSGPYAEGGPGDGPDRGGDPDVLRRDGSRSPRAAPAGTPLGTVAR